LRCQDYSDGYSRWTYCGYDYKGEFTCSDYNKGYRHPNAQAPAVDEFGDPVELYWGEYNAKS